MKDYYQTKNKFLEPRSITLNSINENFKTITKMTKENAIKIFEQKQARTHWDEEQGKWYFPIVDVIAVLTKKVI